MKKTAIYRHYDAAGNLLYVGIATSHLIRLSQHMKTAHWVERIARIDITWMDSRDDALTAEAVAIRDERPDYNVKLAVKGKVDAICAAIGAGALSDRLGVTSHSIRHARTTGTFPASWYAPILDMCEAQGIDCPIDAFNWKTPSVTPSMGEL